MEDEEEPLAGAPGDRLHSEKLPQSLQSNNDILIRETQQRNNDTILSNRLDANSDRRPHYNTSREFQLEPAGFETDGEMPLPITSESHMTSTPSHRLQFKTDPTLDVLNLQSASSILELGPSGRHSPSGKLNTDYFSPEHLNRVEYPSELFTDDECDFNILDLPSETFEDAVSGSVQVNSDVQLDDVTEDLSEVGHFDNFLTKSKTLGEDESQLIESQTRNEAVQIIPESKQISRSKSRTKDNASLSCTTKNRQHSYTPSENLIDDDDDDDVSQLATDDKEMASLTELNHCSRLQLNSELEDNDSLQYIPELSNGQSTSEINESAVLKNTPEFRHCIGPRSNSDVNCSDSLQFISELNHCNGQSTSEVNENAVTEITSEYKHNGPQTTTQLADITTPQQVQPTSFNIVESEQVNSAEELNPEDFIRLNNPRRLESNSKPDVIPALHFDDDICNINQVRPSHIPEIPTQRNCSERLQFGVTSHDSAILQCIPEVEYSDRSESSERAQWNTHELGTSEIRHHDNPDDRQVSPSTRERRLHPTPDVPQLEMLPELIQSTSGSSSHRLQRTPELRHLDRLKSSTETNQRVAEVRCVEGADTSHCQTEENSDRSHLIPQPEQSSSNPTDLSEEIDWSWVEACSSAHEQEASARGGELKPSCWLRASMRRVRPFRLAEPSPSRLAPLATPDTVLDILAENNRRPNSAPGGGSRPRRDFPRRYSSYNASMHNSLTNLTQAAEPVAVESPSSEDEEEEDVSSSSEARTSGGEQGDSSQDTRQESESDTDSSSPLGTWPHNLSSMLASLGCTLGLFNISRFAILSIHFGANFIVQFLFLTLVMGIPLFTLHACLGQCLGMGVMDMWCISPIFQGIGIALLVSQALIGIYSIVGISWMFIYFRDSFITKQDHYRWAQPYDPYREGMPSTTNSSWRLEETVPDYFNGIVLQRYNLETPQSSFGHLKFQVAFNLAVVWMIVFVSLSKGLKSYGKVVYVFSLFPVFGTLVLCTKLLGLTPSNLTHEVFPQTVWTEFFLNTKSWIAATTEVFFTWGLLGASIMQITSHNRNKHLLHRDTSLVIVLTLAVLLLAAFLANTCVTILQSRGFIYVPSSFEHMSTYMFLRAESHPLTSTPLRYMTHTTFIAGSRITVPGVDTHQQSGYQVLRLATELVPSTLALLGADTVSPFWAVLFYFVLILFGIAQQLCVWHCVITGIMAINATTLKSWETTITFFSCACGFILGLPMTTELGIFVVYFLDYTVGCSWWLMVLYVLEIIAVFVVRGRPYSGETIVSTLFTRKVGCMQTWAAPILVFTWNVILPIALVVLCIAVFKNGQFRDLYNWRSLSYDYWPVWTREVGCMLQILPIVVVPLVCVVQSCRYLSDGPPDILDRIQLLYRPSLSRESSVEPPSSPTNSAASAPQVTITPAPAETTTTSTTFEDPPPKYTPPPSYTTATGARIAKLLRRSFRRLTGATGDNSTPASLPPPPDYATVLVEMNQTQRDCGGSSSNIVPEPSSAPSTIARISTLTAADVAHILRSSLRRTAHRRRDAVSLVEGATPIHHDPGSPPSSSQSKPETENTSVI